MDEGGNRIWNISYSATSEFLRPRKDTLVKVEVFKLNANLIEKVILLDCCSSSTNVESLLSQKLQTPAFWLHQFKADWLSSHEFKSTRTINFPLYYIHLISILLTSPGNFYFLRYSSADLQMAESRMFSVTSVAQRLYLQFTNGTFFIDKAIYPPPIVFIHDSDARVRERWQAI